MALDATEEHATAYEAEYHALESMDHLRMRGQGCSASQSTMYVRFFVHLMHICANERHLGQTKERYRQLMLQKKAPSVEADTAKSSGIQLEPRISKVQRKITERDNTLLQAC